MERMFTTAGPVTSSQPIPEAPGTRRAPGRPRAVVQYSLTVGKADDPYEREADEVAARVVSALQRRGDASIGGADDLTSSRIQRMPTGAPTELTSAAGPDGGTVSGAIESRIRSTSGGRALDHGVRRPLEQAFGADFGAVRIHTDSTVTRSIGATAFTSGEHIHFAPGTYAPHSAAGQRLLAHELTHTLQQGAARPVARRAFADVQRDHTDTGMKKKGAVKTFASKVKARTTGAKNPMGSSKDWAGLDANARAAKIVKYVNAELKKAHAPEVTFSLDGSKSFDGAEFDFQTWNVSIGSIGLDGNLSDADIAELADTVYHECRHSEQWFRVARLKAGEAPKPTKTALAGSLFIPERIAKKAIDSPVEPLTSVQKFFHSNHWVERQDTKLAEAQSWYNSVYGANAAHRNSVLGDLANRNAEYRALAEEVDAWDVGGKAKATVRDLLAAVRLKQQAAAAAGGGGG